MVNGEWFVYILYMVQVVWWRKPEENHRPGASHCQTLSHNVASSTLRHELFHYTIHHTIETHHYNTPMLSVCHSISILYYKGIRIYLDHERTRRRIWQNRSHWISGSVSSSPSTSGTSQVNLVTNPVISHRWGKNWENLIMPVLKHCLLDERYSMG
jgi:hypothetical protein